MACYTIPDQERSANAIEAMPAGGTIKISAQRDGSEVMVTVEDSGPGIPAAIAPQLFQPFVTAGKKAGMGLGLAFSRQTVVDHGGARGLCCGCRCERASGMKIEENFWVSTQVFDFRRLSCKSGLY